jgi:plasmid stability protein
MATLTIRNLPDEVRDRLRVRAAQNGRSMEAEAREMLEIALDSRTPEDIAQAVAEAQAWVRSLPGYDPNISMAGELIRERREEAAREEAKTQAWLKEFYGKP